MVLFNYSTKELTAKIVFYGPGLCGKTTNLQFIHKNLGENIKGKMLSLATKTDRTLFFDFLPMDLGEIRGMRTRMQLYTVPGQVFYNETRKLVLKGVDGLVFVADSQKEMLGPNIESIKNLDENLKGHGIKLAEMPHVLQFNKRDLPKLSSIEELNAAINKYNAPFYESVATTGIGVQDTLKAITKLVLLHLTKKYDPRTGAAKPQQAPAEQPARPTVSVPAAAAAIPIAAAATSSASGTADGGGGGGVIPLSTLEQPEVAAPVAQRVASPEPEEPSFDVEDIDDLVDEVQEEPDVRLAGDVAATRPSVEAEPPQDVSAAQPRLEVDIETVPGDEGLPQVSQVAAGVDLFNDPSLEVAHLTAGQSREILIPVEIAGEGNEVTRYKLSLRLRLDPVE